jgi:hypothetical protein
MCGRFLLNSDIGQIITKYKIYCREADKYDVGDFYPSQDAAIVFDNENEFYPLQDGGSLIMIKEEL